MQSKQKNTLIHKSIKWSLVIVVLLSVLGTGNLSSAGAQAEARMNAAVTLPTVLNYHYVKTFGETEVPYLEDTAHLNYPFGLGSDGTSIWITELWGNRALKYSSAGVFQQQIGIAGLADDYKLPTGLQEPVDFSVDGDGNLWLVDSAIARVAKLDPSGALLAELGTPWQSGTDNDHFLNPMGVAIDPAGNIYVSDGAPWWDPNGGNHRIQVFDSSMTYLATIGETGITGEDNAHLHGPRHMTIRGNQLFVADSGNHRIQIFNISNPAAPVYVATLGTSGVEGSDDTHLANPSGVAADASYIYVADTWNGRVQVFDAVTYAYVATVGSGWGTGNYQFKLPYDVALDSSGRLYVADFVNMRVQQYTRSGLTWTYARSYGVRGVPYLTDGYHYNRPSGVAVAGDGSIYITEENGHRLVKLNSAGTPLWTVGVAGVKGDWEDDATHLNNPADVALDTAGHVYVADRWYGRVRIYNSNGTYYKQILNLNCPGGVTVAPNGRVLVADSCDNTVKIYDSSLVLKATLGVPGQAGADNSHFNWPQDVAVDSLGNIFVADQGNQRIQVFNASYAYVRTMGVTGECGGNFDHFCNPKGLFVDSANRLYVVDVDNNRIQVFKTDGTYLTMISGSWGSNNGQFRAPMGVAADSAGNVYVADFSQNHRIQKFAPGGVPGWQQSNINGFGNAATYSVDALETINSFLYAGASNGAQGATIWRTGDGSTWSVVTEPGFGDMYGNTNPVVYDMVLFNSQIYAGTGAWFNDGVGGQIWRSSTGAGGSWNMVEGDGFGTADNTAITNLAVFKNALYASTFNPAAGTEVWRSSTGDSGSWAPVATAGFGRGELNLSVTGLKVFNDQLYVAVESDEGAGAQVWRSSTGNSGDWTKVTSDGFGDVNNFQTGGFALLNGYLYVGTRNHVSGAQIWRSANGTTWEQVVGNGFGDVNNLKIEALISWNGSLLAMTDNDQTGLETWQSSDGVSWSQLNPDSFNNTTTVGTLWSNAVTTFYNQLYLGTWYSGQIWKRMTTTFSDVPSTHPYFRDIEILYANGLTGGCAVNPLKYCPDQIMNRGQAAVFILRANFGSSYMPPAATHIFQDDWSKGTWAEPWAEAMRSEGLSAGCLASPLKYCPWDQIPREQAVIFALRMKYGTLYTPPAATGTLFADMTNPGYYATAWAEQAYKDGIISNCGTTGGKPKFCPKDLVSRGLAAYMIVRAKNLSMPSPGILPPD